MSRETLNLSQAAEHVHMTANELKHCAQRGELEAVERGGEWYFEHRALDEWAQRSLLAAGQRTLAERHRVMELENRLRQMADRKDDTCSADQLWALCGKMERTIRQMERMLDGPYQVTCYPSEPFSDKTAERIFEEPTEEIREQSEYTAKPKAAVSSLLQRVRGK